MRSIVEWFSPFIVPAVIFVLITAMLSAAGYAAQDPSVLQQQATQRIDRVNEYRRRTGDLKGLIGELQQAQSELVTSYQGFTARQDVASALLCLNKLGDVQRMVNQWQQAKALYQQAYDQARKANQPGHQVKALLGYAKTQMYHPVTNDYQAALKLLDEAIRLASDKKDLGDALEMKAEALTELREFNAALEVINRAVALAGDINDQLMLFYAYFDRAQVYVKLAADCDIQSEAGFKICYEALNRAQSDFEQAAGIAKRLGYEALAKPIALSLRAVQMRRDMVKNQEGFYSRIYSEKYTLFHPKRPQDVGVSDEFISRDQSRDDPQLAMLKATLPEYIRKLEKEGDTARSYSQRGLLQEIQGQNDAALQSHLKAVELLEADRRRLRDERTRGAYLEDKMQIFYNAILHLLDRRRNSEAFDLLERSRSRAMADLLQSQELSFTRPEDRRFYAESVKINADISLLQKQLVRYRVDGASQESAEAIANAERQIQKLEGDYQRLQRSIAATGSKLQELMVSKPASLQALQQSMKEDGYEALYYLVLPTQIILWHITGDVMNVRSIFLPREELIKKIAGLRKSLVDGTSTFDQQTARELFLFLVQPALNWIKTDHLVIIPHEDLNYIPFQVLKNWGSDQYLGERFQISYAPSATILLRQKKAASIRSGNLLAVADPQFEEEVKAIGGLYAGRSKIVFGTLAKESEIKAWVGSYDLIHLSVHGKFKTDVPLLSHLILGKGGLDDGLLTAAEMFGLPLEKASLVVLSACETGQIEASHANEMIGMERALLYAGANSLILSSWAVDAASTKLWMETFYREAQSKSLSEAARAALVAVKRRPEYNHPYYWSPFLLIGR
jgi:CHAT domain-containing protein